jgi:hypothetical protein
MNGLLVNEHFVSLCKSMKVIPSIQSTKNGLCPLRNISLKKFIKNKEKWWIDGYKRQKNTFQKP